jgi:hypothetical protein
VVRPHVARTAPFTLADLGGFVVTSFTSFWAHFGWLSLMFRLPVYIALAVVCGLGLIGALVELWQRRRTHNPGLSWDEGPGLWLVVLAMLAVCASMLRYVQTINASGYQGRLFFPMLPSLALLLALGLDRLAGVRWSRQMLIALCSGLLSLAVVGLVWLIRPAYADLYRPATLPTMAQPCLRFGDQVELAAYEFKPAAVHPGETLQVTLHWHVLTDRPRPPTLTVQLLDLDRLPLAEDGFLVSSWRRGDLFVTSHKLAVPADASPARGLLSIQWLDPATLPVTTARGRALGDVAEVGGFKIAPPDRLAAPQHAMTAFFGGFAALHGYDLSVARARPGETLRLTLSWETLAPADADYTVLVHLMDEQGHPLAQADGQPLGGAYPTTLWDAGERIADERLIALGTDIPPGEYRLAVGWYLLATGERLPATDATGTRLPNDMAVLQTVRVVQGGGQ